MLTVRSFGCAQDDITGSNMVSSLVFCLPDINKKLKATIRVIDEFTRDGGAYQARTSLLAVSCQYCQPQLITN